MKTINTYINEKLVIGNNLDNQFYIENIYNIVTDSKENDITLDPFDIKLGSDTYTITRIIKDIDSISSIYTLMDNNGYMVCYMGQSAFDRIFKQLTHGAVYVNNNMVMAKLVK